eukprot:3700496-Lingulodinium_polyedra.AAC.1
MQRRRGPRRRPPSRAARRKAGGTGFQASLDVRPTFVLGADAITLWCGVKEISRARVSGRGGRGWPSQ